MKGAFFILIILLGACTLPCRYCVVSGRYLQPVDTSQPFKVQGKYCVAYTHDTVLEKGMSELSFHVFDRRTGKPITGGVAWFHRASDTTKLIFDKGVGSQVLSAGTYIIDISPLGPDACLPFKIKEIVLPVGTRTELRVYVGSIMQS